MRKKIKLTEKGIELLNVYGNSIKEVRAEYFPEVSQRELIKILNLCAEKEESFQGDIVFAFVEGIVFERRKKCRICGNIKKVKKS